MRHVNCSDFKLLSYLISFRFNLYSDFEVLKPVTVYIHRGRFEICTQ